jgi:hypothetical protein
MSQRAYLFSLFTDGETLGSNVSSLCENVDQLHVLPIYYYIVRRKISIHITFPRRLPWNTENMEWNVYNNVSGDLYVACIVNTYLTTCFLYRLLTGVLLCLERHDEFLSASINI